MPRSRRKGRKTTKHSIHNENVTSCPIFNKTITNLSKHLSSPANQHCNHILGDRTIVSLIPSAKQNYKINNHGQSNQYNSNTVLLSHNHQTVDTIQSIHTSTDMNQSQFISSVSNLPFAQKEKTLVNSHDDFNMDVDSVDNSITNDQSHDSNRFNKSTESILLGDIIMKENTTDNLNDTLMSSYDNNSNDILNQLQQLQITPSDLSSNDSKDHDVNMINTTIDNNINDNDCEVDNQIPIIRCKSKDTSRRVTRSMLNNNTSDNTIHSSNEDYTNKQPNNQQLFVNPDNISQNETLSGSTVNSQPRILNQTTIDLLPHKYDYRKYQLTIWKNRYDHIPIDSDTLSSLKLMKIMSKSNIPNYLFTEIMQWYEESYLAKLDAINDQNEVQVPSHCYNSIPKNKDKVIKDIKSILIDNEERFDLKPNHKILQLPSGRFVRHSSISLEAIIYSLISIPEILNEQNSLLHNKYYRNPELIDSVPKSERYYHDIHTGWWFKNAYNKHCTNIHDVLCPVILFIDGTAIDPVGKLKLEAIMLTLGIFTREMRNKAEAWRLLGFICDPSKENLGNDKYTNQVEKRTDYHHMLKELLQELYDLEASDGILIDLPTNNGNDVETIRLKICLMFVMGDAVGHDNLCDMFLSYTSASAYLCRDCNCPSKHLNDPLWECQITNRQHLILKSTPELLKLCYYKIDNNAFNRHGFGGDNSNINGCSPPEILHQFLKGPMEDTINHFFETITIPGLDFLVEVGKYISLNWHRQSARDFPNIQIFKDGLQKKHLCGKELFSQLFMIYLSLVQTYTMKFIPNIERTSQPRFKLKRDKVEDNHDALMNSQVEYSSNGSNSNKDPKKNQLFI